MKWKLLLFGMALLLIAKPAFPQTCAVGQSCSGSITAQDSGACSVTGACTVLPVPNNTAAIMTQLSGTFTATLQFEATADGVNWAAASGTVLGSVSTATSATAVGVWRFSVPGAIAFRVRCSSYASGTVTVQINASNGSSMGGGGTVTSVSGTANQIASTGGTTPVLSLTSPVVFPGNISGPAGWAISSAGAMTLSSGGTNQNITLTPIGTGFTLLNGNVGAGVTPGTLTKLQAAGMGLFTAGVPDPGDGTPAGLEIGYNTVSNYGFINSIQTGVTGKVLNIQTSGGFVRIGDATAPGTALDVLGTARATSFATATNCSSAASPAACGSAAAGSFVIAAAATSAVVNTTAVTSASKILLVEDQSLGTFLGVTCNTGISSAPVVSARVAATSFTVIIAAALAVNPGCYSYFIVG